MAKFWVMALPATLIHMTAPDEQASGAVRSMQAALKDSGLSIDDIDYINAHGTATPVNDVMETKAIKEVFGKRAYSIPVSSTKSMHAHTLGAAGALEGIVSVLALQHGFIPPTINYQESDPQCDLDYVTSGSRNANLRSGSFQFLCLRRQQHYGNFRQVFRKGRGP